MPFFPTDIENKALLPLEQEGLNSYSSPLLLDSLLISDRPSTFFARVAGSEKDLIIIDKSADIVNGALVVLYVDDEFVVKRYPLELPEGVAIWGRVVYYIQSL
ncbi:MAG: S24 family peptidase [Rikenellaceae bacterium]